MSDTPPQIPNRPLLNTYVQRLMRIGGRVIIVTLITGLAGGYVGARAFLPDTPQNAGGNGSVAGDDDVDDDIGTDLENLRRDIDELDEGLDSFDGVYDIVEGDMNHGQGSFEGVQVRVEQGKLAGQGTLRGQTGPGPVEFGGTVAQDGTFEGTMDGHLPSGQGDDLVVKATVTGTFDGTRANLEWSGKAGYTDLFGTLVLQKAGEIG